jgi:hypothetical protein
MFIFTVLRMEQAQLAAQAVSFIPTQEIEHDANLQLDTGKDH